MNCRHVVVAILFALVTPFSLHGCGEDSAGPGTSPADFRGVWDVEGVVTAKKTCDGEIGEMRQWDVTIAQDGRRGIISFGGTPHELSIEGSTATASWPEESDIELRLTIADGALGGTVTATRAEGEAPACTEVWELSGTRSGASPAPGFEGTWDLTTEVTFSSCDGETFGETEELCRRIDVDGVSISIDDSDGTILGVIDGNSAILWRIDSETELTIEITAEQGVLAGSIHESDTVDNCVTNLSLSGSSRQGDPCPPAPEPSRFEGSWYPDVFATSTSGCFLVEPRDQYFGSCLSVTVDGSSVTIDDGSGRGLLNGSMGESGVVVSRDEGDGIYELRLQMGEEGLIGDSSKNYTSGECSGGSLEFEFDGFRLPLPCDSSGGPFAGAWNLEVQLTINECEFGPADPECVEIFQNGDQVFIEGAFLEGNRATVSGNSLTIHEETVFEDTRFTLDTVLNVGAGGSTLSGTQTLTIESLSSSQSCTTSANITGTPTTDCQPNVQRATDANVFGLRIEPRAWR